MQSTQNTQRKKKCWNVTAQKLKFSIKDFFSKCDQMRSFLRIFRSVCVSLNAALRILRVINWRRVRYSESSFLKAALILFNFLNKLMCLISSIKEKSCFWHLTYVKLWERKGGLSFIRDGSIFWTSKSVKWIKWTGNILARACHILEISLALYLRRWPTKRNLFSLFLLKFILTFANVVLGVTSKAYTYLNKC